MAAIIPRRDEILVATGGVMAERWVKYFENLNSITNNTTTVVESEVQVAGSVANPDLIFSQVDGLKSQVENLTSLVATLSDQNQRITAQLDCLLKAGILLQG